MPPKFRKVNIDNLRPDLIEALKDVRLRIPGVITQADLQEAQLREWPDSILLSISDVFNIPRHTDFRENGVWRWIAIAMSHLEHGPVQFYLCGKQPDGRYQWMGMRFGVKGHEYMSGCPINNIRAPEEVSHAKVQDQ